MEVLIIFPFILRTVIIGSRLELLKSLFNAKKIHTQVVLIYLQPFRRNSLLKCARQPKIVLKKFTINPFWGFTVVYGHRR